MKNRVPDDVLYLFYCFFSGMHKVVLVVLVWIPNGHAKDLFPNF